MDIYLKENHSKPIPYGRVNKLLKGNDCWQIKKVNALHKYSFVYKERENSLPLSDD